MEILRVQVGVVPHSYQGKDGAFEGPQCSKILDELEILEPYLQGVDGVLFHNLLVSFQRELNERFLAQNLVRIGKEP